MTRAFAERLGYPPEHFVGKRPEEFSTEASARRIREEHLPRFRRTGRLDNVPIAFRDHAGVAGFRWLPRPRRYYAAGWRSASLRVGLYTQLSDRARLERQVPRPLPVDAGDAAHDRSGQPDHRGQRSLAEKLGYTREEVIGRPVSDFLTDESRRSAEKWTVARSHCRR